MISFGGNESKVFKLSKYGVVVNNCGKIQITPGN